MKDLIKLEGEIDLRQETAETRIKPIDGDVWSDFGYWLEATGFMAYQAMKYREWNEEQVIKYATDYFRKCLNDYKIKNYAI